MSDEDYRELNRMMAQPGVSSRHPRAEIVSGIVAIVIIGAYSVYLASLDHFTRNAVVPSVFIFLLCAGISLMFVDSGIKSLHRREEARRNANSYRHLRLKADAAMSGRFMLIFPACIGLTVTLTMWAIHVIPWWARVGVGLAAFGGGAAMLYVKKRYAMNRLTAGA